MPLSELVDLVLEALGVGVQELSLWARAGARVLPVVILVPAFGLRAVPAPLRVALAGSLGIVLAPALIPAPSLQPLPILLALEFLRGLPVAVVAATALWVASMAGGLLDNLRSAQDTVTLPNVEPKASPMGALLTMLVAIAFLQSGGAEQAAAALVEPRPISSNAVIEVVQALSSGIGLAVAIMAPLLAVAIVVEVAGALVARAASPAFIQPILAPLRSFVILGVFALLLERIVAFLVVLSQLS